MLNALAALCNTCPKLPTAHIRPIPLPAPCPPLKIHCEQVDYGVNWEDIAWLNPTGWFVVLVAWSASQAHGHCCQLNPTSAAAQPHRLSTPHRPPAPPLCAAAVPLDSTTVPNGTTICLQNGPTPTGLQVTAEDKPPIWLPPCEPRRRSVGESRCAVRGCGRREGTRPTHLLAIRPACL